MVSLNRLLPLGIAAAFLLPTLVGCGGASADRPNVVLISLDTMRTDHLSVYGYSRPTSPRLERFAAEGARFDMAYAPIATTGPSHSSMFTSLYPLAHHVVKNGIELSDDCETIAELLSARGYATGAVMSSIVLTERYGYDQGFDWFEDEFTLEGSSVKPGVWEGERVTGGFDRRADDATGRAVAWLEEKRDPDRPFFLFLHYFDPHSPYDPPEGFRNRLHPAGAPFLDDLIGRYDEEVLFTDEQVGVFLDALDRLGLAEDTVVIVTGDHGEGLGQHNHLEHGVNVYDEAVRVPLIVRWPGRVPAGSVHTAPVELVDLAPTIMNIAGFPGSRGFQGRSLYLPLLGEEHLEEVRPVFLHRRHYEPGIEGRVRVAGEKFGVRLGNWKLVLGPEENTYELYDLNADPGEQRNLYEAQPEIVERLTGILERWKGLVAREGKGVYELSEEDRAALAALGYGE